MNTTRQEHKVITATHRFCVAPMMAWTNKHARYFLRLISESALLYTEMVPLNGLLHGDQARFLEYNQFEHPLALQIGGSDPKGLAQATRIAREWGYTEINLNLGCPSNRVTKANFGACLMEHPSLVAECVHAMVTENQLPITVKCRIGINNMDTGKTLDHFIEQISKSGCQTIILHARQALLDGLSPKENREIPPLDYKRVYQIKKDFPELSIIINGGITDLDQSLNHLRYVDGVMLGRAAYQDPFLLATVDQKIFDSKKPTIDRANIIQRLVPYCEQELELGTPLHHITRHIMGLFRGCPGGKLWRRHLSTKAIERNATSKIIVEALQSILPNHQTPSIT
jgi:tRNA-dihydrouridine synthase A